MQSPAHWLEVSRTLCWRLELEEAREAVSRASSSEGGPVLGADIERMDSATRDILRHVTGNEAKL